jgi:hypothetical protein
VTSDHLNSVVFRAALIVLMLMGMPVIGILVYLNIQKAKEKPAVIAPATDQPSTPESESVQ